jgi:hypothetical protein
MYGLSAANSSVLPGNIPLKNKDYSFMAAGDEGTIVSPCRKSGKLFSRPI